MFRHIPSAAATAAAVLVMSGSAFAGPAQASDVDLGNRCDTSFEYLLEQAGADVDLAGFAAVSGDLEPLLDEFYERQAPFGAQVDLLYYGALGAGVDEFEDFDEGLEREIAAELALVEAVEADLALQEAELTDAQAALEAAEDDDAAAAAQARIDAAEDAIGSLRVEITEREVEIEFLRGVPEGLAEANAQLDAVAAELQPSLESLIGTDSGVEDAVAFNGTREVLEHCADEIDALLAGAQEPDEDEDDEDDDSAAPVATPVAARATFTG